jgi:4,5-DOPA dioxygenase extradiol
MAALDPGPYADALAAFGKTVSPRVLIVISAHWEGSGVRIASAARPELIYDFGGFPRELYELKYPAPGSPDVAAEIAKELSRDGIEAILDDRRGWDHGVWVPLRLMFPEARTPVVEVSLPMRATSLELFRIGQSLTQLRERGALILGSGGIVHNLRLMNFAQKNAPPDAWALEFQEWVRSAVERRDLESLFQYRKLAPHAARAVPTEEHFLPLFPVLGAAGNYSQVKPICEGIEHANMSLNSFALVA